MPRGAVTFVFDDGYRKVLEDVVPLLNEIERPGVFAIPLDLPSTSLRGNDRGQSPAPVASWEEWQERLVGTKHELAAHSATHTDLTTLIDDKLDHELGLPVEQLGSRTLVYPGGGYDQRVAVAAQRYYAAARSTDWGFESLSTPNTFALRTFNYSQRNWSLWKANLRVCWAWITNAWLIETFHLISNEPSDYEFIVTLDNFKKHLAFVQRLSISVRTINDVITKC